MPISSLKLSAVWKKNTSNRVVSGTRSTLIHNAVALKVILITLEQNESEVWGKGWSQHVIQGRLDGRDRKGSLGAIWPKQERKHQRGLLSWTFHDNWGIALLAGQKYSATRSSESFSFFKKGKDDSQLTRREAHMRKIFKLSNSMKYNPLLKRPPNLPKYV